MDEQQALTDFVIGELSKHKSKNDIIQFLATHHQMNWYKAEAFVNGVSDTHSKQIARGSAPLMLGLSVALTLVGLGLAGTMVFLTLRGWIIFFITFPVPWLGNIVYFLTGAGFFAGGLLGLSRTIKKSL